MAGVFSKIRKVSNLASYCRAGKIDRQNAVQSRPMLFASLKRSKSFTYREYKEPGPDDDDYQYISKSLVPTLHYQRSLPRLPVPPLKETCARYLRAQRQLLKPRSYNRTESYVEEFLREDGVKCQKLLTMEDNKNKNTSYISKPWFDMYLSNRSPLPINLNPCLVYTNDHTNTYGRQLIKAANLVISSLRFYRSLNENCLVPEVYYLNPKWSNSKFFKTFTGSLPEIISWYGAYLFKAYPLDMSQYSNLFNTTRIPELGKDRINYAPGARHLLVMRRGHFYIFDVLNKDGSIISPGLIVGALKQILKMDEPVPEHPVGILTTADRDTWAIARKHLETIGNKEVLELIDTSLFNLVLDDESPGLDHIKMVKQFLHSDGVNRWFDKSISLIVAEDGRAGINFEHSWGDGVAVLRYFNQIFEDSLLKPQVSILSEMKKFAPIRKLDFKLDDKAKCIISEVKRNYQNTCSYLEVRVMNYQQFGRDHIKPFNISPDALMQLAFQIAQYKLFGKAVTTYESCSTAAFKHGRTETVRPGTQETQSICKALKDLRFEPSQKQLQNMIIQCSKVHTNLIKEAAMGLGFDRHLFALKLKADELGLKPAVFSDPSYGAINYNIISTSTLNSNWLELGAFGPVVPNGYGIGYSVWKNGLGCIITNYSGQSDGAGFFLALGQSLGEIEVTLGA